MADVVQYRLERMVDELDDLEKRGFFTRREIAEIVKQRRKFEYRMKRHSPLKQDYLAYIEYEKQVDSLRNLRKRSVTRELRKNGNKRMRKGVSDYAAVSRILEIYRAATVRFKGDIGLWFQYLEYCREKKNGRMKKVLAQVIRFHPKVPGIWIYAAAWEFDHNLNVAAARALMQNGLRVCPSSEELWVEYLRMELTYLNKLKARKVALGEDEGKLVREHRDVDEEHWREENKELFMSLNEERKNGDASDVQNGEPNQPDLFREQGSIILRTIYGGAIKALPRSLSLRKRFFEILKGTNLAQSEEMQKELLGDMKRDFSTEPEYWDWLAKLEVSDPKILQMIESGTMASQLNKAIKVYEEALTMVPSAMIFDLYTQFLVDAIVKRGEDQSLCLSSQNVDLTSHLLLVYEKAETMGCITEDLACQHVSFYLRLGRVDEARKLAEKLCNGKLADATQLWLLRVSIEMRCIAGESFSLSKADLLCVFELLRKVLTKGSIFAAESLWLMALKFFANQKRYFDKLVEMSLDSLAREGGSESGFSLSSAFINSVLQKDGIQQARQMYKRYLALPHPGLALYRICIELEVNLASGGDKDCLVNARKLYESALTTYDQDARLWQDYHSMEIKMGTSVTANAIYWRARKTLKDTADFLANEDL